MCAQSTQKRGLPSTNRTSTSASGKAGAATGTEPGATSRGRERASQGRTGPRRRGPGPHPPSWARRDTPAGNLQGPHLSVPGEAVQEAVCVQSSSSACSWGCQEWVPPGLRARTGQERLPGPHSPSRPPPPASPWARATRPRPPPSPREASVGLGHRKEPRVCQSETGGVGAVLPPPRLESVTNTAGEGTRPASIRKGDARGAGPTWIMSASFCSPAVLVNTPAPGEAACWALTPTLQAGEASTPAPALPAISQLSPTAKLHLLPNGGPRVERSVHSGRAARLPFPAARREARQGQHLQGGQWNLKRGSMVT